MKELRTQVVIVGAGPAGLLLGHLLEREGVDNVVLERRSREYLEQRVRAGVIEFGVANLIDEAGAGERLRREGLVHHGVEFRFERHSYRVPLSELADGKTITVYGQQEVVKDLIALRLQSGAPLLFNAEVAVIDGLTSDEAFVEGEDSEGKLRISCQYVAGCDGSFGVANRSIPASLFRKYERTYPFSWLGILAEAPPTSEELIYCRHESGFALYSMRSTTLSRLYLGVRPSDTLDAWSDDRIWDELNVRLATDATSELRQGPIVERSITNMRSVVVSPMRHGRLFLAGDAAHIVPPTGAKGMNLALGDVRVLARALLAQLQESDDSLLATYSATCLERVWRAEEFSNYMTQMLHPSDEDDFENGVQLARLRQAVHSHEASAVLARNYVDLNSL
ncbi:MAG TPA: 4-hydroxybenzoate 3-monooxygenase [Acidimicrobiales bacterium]|nr:4-hydroxybenzoate 3-monooxygenase [Acidimicrobiales bacterium]